MGSRKSAPIYEQMPPFIMPDADLWLLLQLHKITKAQTTYSGLKTRKLTLAPKKHGHFIIIFKMGDGHSMLIYQVYRNYSHPYSVIGDFKLLSEVNR